MQDQTAFRNALSMRRAAPLQSALLTLKSYVAGETLLTNGSSLNDVFGDFHCSLLWNDLKQRYGVTEVAGVLAVDPQRVNELASGKTRLNPMQAVMQDFETQLRQYAALAVNFPEMRDVDRRDAQTAIFEVMEAATLRAMRDDKAR